MKQPWLLSSFTMKITLKEAGSYSALMLVCLFNIKPSQILGYFTLFVSLEVIGRKKRRPLPTWCKGYQPDTMKCRLGGYLWGNAISSVRQQMGTKEPPWRFQTNFRRSRGRCSYIQIFALVILYVHFKLIKKQRN